MALPSWCGDVVTVLRPVMVTRRGVQVPDWSSPTPHTEAGCSVQEGTSSTDFPTAQRDPTASDATLYAPPTADIKSGDRVTLGGRTWTVDGVPFVRRSPTGRVSHKQARLKEWRG